MMLNSVLPKLKATLNGVENIEVAILFGSIAKDEVSAHDVDIAVELKKESLMDLGYIISKVAEALQVNEEHVDVLSLSQCSPILLLRIIENGIIVKGESGAIERLLERAQKAPDALMELRMWSNFDPKLDKLILTSRVEEVRRNANFIKDEILCKRVEELSYKELLALERAMHRVIESMLDVCRHLVSVYSLGLVESYGEYPQRLVEANKIPKNLAEDITKLAGLRNILVHHYLKVRTDLLYETAKDTVERIVDRFIEWVKSIAV